MIKIKIILILLLITVTLSSIPDKLNLIFSQKFELSSFNEGLKELQQNKLKVKKSEISDYMVKIKKNQNIVVNNLLEDIIRYSIHRENEMNYKINNLIFKSPIQIAEQLGLQKSKHLKQKNQLSNHEYRFKEKKN